MIKLQYLDRYIGDKLIALDKERESSHESSGKLTASMLGMPMQWNILKVIGVPKDPMDEYTLRKFVRGRQIEEWLRENLPGIINREKFVEYKNTIGFVDALVDMRDWNLPDLGVIPHEIKSVTNAAFKWIIKEGGARENHRLQATLYALALGASHYVIEYLASDDLRVETFLYETKDTSEQVEKEIEDFHNQLATRIVPVFTPTYGWTEKKEYNSYLRFVNLTEKEIEEVLKAEYPQSYEKLRGGVLND
jgi:hypothetical protein